MSRKTYYSAFLQASQERGYAFLRQSRFFKECSEAFLARLMQDLKTELFSAGDLIMQEGGVADNLFCLEMGQVDILVGSDYVKVGSVGEGSVFGEMAMFQHLGPSFARRSASVKATCFCVCRVISHIEFHQILKRFPKEKHIFEKVALQRQQELSVKKKEADEFRITAEDKERSAVLWDTMKTRICAVRSYEREVAKRRACIRAGNEAGFEQPWYSSPRRELSDADAYPGDPESKISPSCSAANVATSPAAENQGGSLRPSTSATLANDSELELVHGEAEQTQQQRPVLLVPKTTGLTPRLASPPRSPMSSRPHTGSSRQKLPTERHNKAANSSSGSAFFALRQCKHGGLPSLPEGISPRGLPPQTQISFEAVPPAEIPRHWAPFTEPTFAPMRPVTAPTTAAPKSARTYLENLKVPKGSRRWIVLE